MIRIQNISNKDFKQINILYHQAFLKEERIEIQTLISKQNEYFHFLSIYDDDTWVGFVYTVSDASLTYIYYFAIDSRYRNKGYGSKTIELLKEMYANIILCIEEVDEKYQDNAHRKERMQFYLKNGFYDMNFHFRENGYMFQMLCFGMCNDHHHFYKLMYDFLGERYNKMRGIV